MPGQEMQRQEDTSENILIQIGGVEHVLPYSEFLESMGVRNVIRIPAHEFETIDFEKGFLTHFNLQSTSHEVGRRYLVLPIVRSGTRAGAGRKEQLPLLSTRNSYIVECIETENGISPSNLTEEDFAYSMPHITDSTSLEEAVYTRYASSIPGLTREDVVQNGVARTTLKIVGRAEDVPRRISISKKNGFQKIHTESISSTVFTRDGMIYKLSQRNSPIRAQRDYETLHEQFAEHEDHIPTSEICEAEYEGQVYTCVVQNTIQKGATLKDLNHTERMQALQNNKEFLLALMSYFFECIENKTLYPDPIGHPADQSWHNSTNLMLDRKTGKIMLCDVGLSCHEDTVLKYDGDFYASPNAKTYMENLPKMQEFVDILLSLD
jgi:hypothetical protein